MKSILIAAAALSLISGMAEARGSHAAPASEPAPVNRTEFDRAPWWAKQPVIAQIGYVRTEV